MISDFLVFGAGFVLLLTGAEIVIRSASAAAAMFRVPSLLVGILLIGFGTSLPELAVGVDAALVGAGDVAVGSVIGSNLCNGALILGLAALVRPLTLPSRLRRWELPILVAVSVAIAVFLADAVLSRVEAALLLTALAAYLVGAIRGTGDMRASDSPGEPVAVPSRSLLVVSIGAGAVALVLGAQWLVEGATLVARDLGVSEASIAISMVAFGTSLPELAMTVVAARRGAHELVAGNLIGSNLFNNMAILGLSAMASPLHTVDVKSWEIAAFVVSPLLIVVLARSGRVGRRAGAALLVGYAGVMAALFQVS